MAFHLAPAPINLALAVAVWRSAGTYEGPRQWVEAARVSAIGWTGLLMLL